MRLYGIETEYGLAVEGSTPHSQLEHAAELVGHCQVRAFPGWDYRHESPRSDLRGFEADELAVDPVDAQFDEGRSARDVRADRVLVNGARFYNDHGHPEYATPECSRLMELIAHDRAGERIVLDAARAYSESIGRKVSIYKNNSDFHGASYGTHENYLVSRDVPFESLFKGLLPLFIARIVLVGAGKPGSEVGRPCRYQISQRADFFQETLSVDTLYRRPIFNTRDEPHADSNSWIRLHVICGDANRMEWATAMKVAMTSLALDLIRIGEAPAWRLCNPTRALEAMSKDEDYKWRIELENGSWTDAIEVLDSYLSAATAHFAGRNAETEWALSEWRLALTDLSIDPMRLADRCDWVAKLKMLNEFAEAEGRWDAGTMQSLDLAYHNLDPEEGLFPALEAMGRVVRLVDAERILDAMTAPPASTRASLRGRLVSEAGDKLQTVGWRRAVLKEGEELSVIEFPVEPDSTRGRVE